MEQGKAESIGEVYMLASGALLVRLRGGRRLRWGKLATIEALEDGTARLVMLAEWIDTERAMDILDVPWTTLRRLMEGEAIVARKRTQGRWIVRLDTVLDLRAKIEADPHFWETFQPVKTDFQGFLTLD